MSFTKLLPKVMQEVNGDDIDDTPTNRLFDSLGLAHTERFGSYEVAFPKGWEARSITGARTEFYKPDGSLAFTYSFNWGYGGRSDSQIIL